MINWFLLSFISTCIAWFAPSSENAMMHLEVVVLIDYKRKCITYSYYILSWFSFFFLCLFTLHILGFPCTLACRARMNDAWKNCRLQICHFPWFVKLVKKGQNTYCYVSIKYMSVSIKYIPVSVQYIPVSIKYIPFSIKYMLVSINYIPVSVKYLPWHAFCLFCYVMLVLGTRNA